MLPVWYTLDKEYIKILKICRSELSPKNKITAINQMATPVLTYGFGFIDWPQREIDNLDVKTRKILTMHKILYRNQCMDRVYLPRREGGLGLIEINDVFRQTIINLDFYLRTTPEEHISKVKDHHQENLAESKSITKLAKVFQRTHLESSNNGHQQENENLTTENQPEETEEKPAKHPYTHVERSNKRKRWQTNKRAGRYYEELQKNYIDQAGSVQWIQNGELKYDEERLLISCTRSGSYDQRI